jgi:ubiquinone/menaquinone biosynthesis C-methylase UbiE
MEPMTDRDVVRTQYARGDTLRARRSVWGPGPEGVSPTEVLRTAVVAARPMRVLEIGCGTGDFARSVMDALPGSSYLATDLSAGMVESAAALGVNAQQVPAEDLPFPDGAFDCVVAAWMLYHVPDLDRTLAHVRRVLAEPGRFCVATNGERHLADLVAEAGGRPLVTQFTSENAEEVLGRHFDHVSRRDIETRATFADHASARAYLATFDADLAVALPYFEGPRAYAGHTSVLTAH